MSTSPGWDRLDPDAVVAAVMTVPVVRRLDAGLAGTVATYLPGRRVGGVRMTETEIEVHVVADYGPSVDEVATAVRAVVMPLADGRPVHVVIADLVLPGEEPPDPPVPALPAGNAPLALPPGG